jgi:hypothetical protein
MQSQVPRAPWAIEHPPLPLELAVNRAILAADPPTSRVLLQTVRLGPIHPASLYYVNCLTISALCNLRESRVGPAGRIKV